MDDLATGELGSEAGPVVCEADVEGVLFGQVIDEVVVVEAFESLFDVIEGDGDVLAALAVDEDVAEGEVGCVGHGAGSPWPERDGMSPCWRCWAVRKAP